MGLAKFIRANSTQIIAEWEAFAHGSVVAASHMNIVERRDHVAGMLDAIVLDLETPQSKRTQASKSKGENDADVESDTPANAHGTDRAATGFSPVDVVSEFRALRASVLRLWTEARHDYTRENLEEVTRFNESIDQLLAESMARYAQDVERSKDLFLGVLGHDLRNPLGAIMMSATVMLTHDGPEGTHSTTAARILNAGTRMDRLIGDLVDFTRTRLGAGIPVVRAAMDMEVVCRQTIDEIMAFHPRTIVRFAASGVLVGAWDAGRIAQALSNLCGNAFQHGALDAPIDVTLRGEPDHVVMTVHNLGDRIPPGRLREIFNPFTQLAAAGDRHKDVRSVVLGLYIVRAIVLAHHGTIDVASNDSGTTFTARFPRSASL